MPDLPVIVVTFAVLGFPEECFCGDLKDVTIPGVNWDGSPATVLDDPVTVVLSVGGETILSETYYPDADGKIVIRRLGELLLPYFTLPVAGFVGSSRDASIQVQLSLTSDQVGNNVKTSVVHYSRLPINHDFAAPYLHLLSRYQEKKTAVGRVEMVSGMTGISRVDVGVAYLLNGVAKYTKIQLGNIVNCTTMNVSIDVITAQLNTSQSLTLTPADVLYYDLYAVQIVETLESVVDKIRLVHDTRNYPHPVNIAYYNCFGVMETITLTGIDERSVDLGGEFAYADAKYRKIDTVPVVSDKVYTGHIDQQTAQALEDLVTSDLVFLYENGVLTKEITITDIEMVRKKPSYEPIGYAITYRPVDKRHLEFTQRVLPTGIFDSTFDYTFD